MKSYINRHDTENIFHFILFIIHDFFIPLFLISSIFQVFLFKSSLHKWNGILLTQFLMYPLFISGLFLSFYSQYPYLFIVYGLSFLLFALHTRYRYRSIFRHFHFYLFFSWVIVFYHLCLFIDIKKLQFINVTLPVPFLHLYNTIIPVYNHKKTALQYMYLCWLGTFFSITQDHYWIWPPNYLSLPIKLLLQQIPFIIFLWIS